MALTPVGQFQTVVNVNGNERINTTQADDQTYNITESLGADIQVNGTTEGSFSQTSDSTYNVDVSASGTGNTIDVTYALSGGRNDYNDIGGPLPPAVIIKDNEVYIQASRDSEGDASASVGDVEVSPSEFEDFASTTTTVTGVENFHLSIGNADTNISSSEARVSFTMYTDIGVNVNGVSQS